MNRSLHPTRVMMTADTAGGVWTYALELSRALAAHGIIVTLATMGAPLTRAQATDAAGVANLEVHESSFKLEWMDNPWNDVEAAGEWLLQIAETCEPDIVHLNGFVHGTLPWRAPVVMVAHSCVLSWWRAVKGGGAPDNWTHYGELVGAGLRAADLVVAPSRAMLNSARGHYGPFSESTVIYNGRSPQLFEPDTKQDFLFAAGRFWDEAKNVSVLTEIAPRIEWPIYLAGQTQKAKHQSKIPNIRVVGHLTTSEMASWLSRASIFIAPAKYEPFGLSILEAALAGCALVLGDISSLREIWADAAEFVAPDNAALLQDRVEKLIRDPLHRAKMSARARERALHFTPKIMAIQYVAAYSGLLQAATLKQEQFVCVS